MQFNEEVMSIERGIKYYWEHLGDYVWEGTGFSFKGEGSRTSGKDFHGSLQRAPGDPATQDNWLSARQQVFQRSQGRGRSPEVFISYKVKSIVRSASVDYKMI